MFILPLTNPAMEKIDQTHSARAICSWKNSEYFKVYRGLLTVGCSTPFYLDPYFLTAAPYATYVQVFVV
jgi:hypothetical protein